MKKILLFALVLILSACKKNKEHCWQVYDRSGNEMGIECDKTESEIQEKYGQYYNRADAPKYCWMYTSGDGTTSYLKNITEKYVALFFNSNNASMEKVACGYCQQWNTRQKIMLKPSGLYTIGPGIVQQFCGDTCSTLYAGRLVVVRETADSIIYHEFLKKY